ncbi:MAG: MFS transporter [Phycisphaerales bacterium]
MVAIISHVVVDFFSFIVVPLLSVIEGRVALSPWQGTMLVAIGSVASGVIQPIVALLSDRHDTRWFGTLGFGALVVAIGSVGYAESFGALVLIQVVGAGGSGAFHPVAAAAVGQLSGRRRSGGLAWFYAAGMVGGVLGNLVSPEWVRHFSRVGQSASFDPAQGLRSLAWLIAPGLVFAAMLAAAIHGSPHRHAGAHADHARLSRAERLTRWRSVWLLYFGNVLRFTVDMCLITLIVRWSEVLAVGTPEAGMVGADVGAMLTPELRSEASKLNGHLQAARQVGMGVGGLAIMFLLRGRAERMLLIAVPLVGAGCMALTPWAAGAGVWMIVVLCALAGLGYGGVMPTTLSLAQRLLPHRTSLASALMLGGAWAFASIGPHLAQWLFGTLGLSGAMLIVAMLLGASGVLGWMLRLPGRG